MKTIKTVKLALACGVALNLVYGAVRADDGGGSFSDTEL